MWPFLLHKASQRMDMMLRKEWTLAKFSLNSVWSIHSKMILPKLPPLWASITSIKVKLIRPGSESSDKGESRHARIKAKLVHLSIHNIKYSYDLRWFDFRASYYSFTIVSTMWCWQSRWSLFGLPVIHWYYCPNQRFTENSKTIKNI